MTFRKKNVSVLIFAKTINVTRERCPYSRNCKLNVLPVRPATEKKKQINFRPLKFILEEIMKCSRRSLFKCRSNCALLSAPSAVTSSVRPIIYSGGISDPDRYLFVHIYSDQNRRNRMENRPEGVSFRQKKSGHPASR